MPTFEHGVASCNHLGKLSFIILDSNEGLCVDLTPGKVCKALCDAGWIQTPGIQRSLHLLQTLHNDLQGGVWQSVR